MANPNWALGRTGQIHLVEETAYGVVSTQLPTTALRHLNFSAHYDPKSLDKSPERHIHPSTLAMLTRRAKATWGLKAQLYPSGTLNTLPEADLLLKNALGGTPSNIVLSTTLAPPAPVASLVTTSGGTVTNGAHSFKWGFRSATGESLPSAASNAVTTDGTHNQVSLTVPLGPAGTTARVLYATEADANPAVAANFKHAHVIANNADVTYVFDQADASLTKTLTGITQAAGTATATLAGHGGAVGERVTIAGADQGGYNITAAILAVPLTSTFTFAVAAGTVSPATGATITAYFNPPIADASGLLSATAGFVASATGLAVNQFLQIAIASGVNAGVYARVLTAVSGTNLTWSPALPGAPAAGDTVKGVVTYGLGTDIPKSLDICHYPQAPSAWYNREILGAVIDKFSLVFDSNLEPQLDVSGPAAEMVDAQTQPVAFTTVGAENGIPSGLTGSFLWGGVAYQIEKLSLDIANAMELQNTAFGTAKATGFLRKGKRAVTLKVDAKVSDDLTMFTPSLTPNSGTLFLQCGLTSGKIWALYVPIAQLMNPPDTGDADETSNWSFDITALGSAGNDDVLIAAC